MLDRSHSRVVDDGARKTHALSADWCRVVEEVHPAHHRREQGTESSGDRSRRPATSSRTIGMATERRQAEARRWLWSGHAGTAKVGVEGADSVLRERWCYAGE